MRTPKTLAILHARPGAGGQLRLDALTRCGEKRLPARRCARMKKLALVALMLFGTTAHAEVITGTFRYLDADMMYKPIRRATVEVIRQDPGGFNWTLAATLTTNDSGSITTMVPFVANAKYSVRVYAENPAATVWKRDVHWEKFYGNAGERNAGVSPSSTLNFDYNDPYLFDANHFNIADTILHGFDYVNARRAPGEVDAVDPVSVFPILGGNTFYDPIANALRIQDGFAQDDRTILHEYGHYLEDKISGFRELAAGHTGCSVHSAEGISMASYAWMEGFPSYFAMAVSASLPPGTINFDFNGTTVGNLDAPSCSPITTSLYEIEDFVSGALFDIIDQFTTSESADRLCTTPDNPMDRKVFLVFDRLNLGWTNPSLQDFVNGWIAADFDLEPLIRAFGPTAAGLIVPPFMRRYDASPAANLAYWKPSTGVWMINGGENGVSQQWGEAGGSDIPLPRDYDGDGFTDLLVYRPNGGTWFLISSRTGRMTGTQWGAPGDVPVPGNYDGDDDDDFAVYRPGNNDFIIHVDGGCKLSTQPTLYHFAIPMTGTPLAADYNRDGREDPILYIPQTRTFHVLDALTGIEIKTMTMDSGGTPFVANFDGSGRLDFATYAAGTWQIKDGDTNEVLLNTVHGGMWDTPVPADYNGDGITEIAIYTPSSRWVFYPWRRFQIDPVWGEPGAIPVPAP